ncbi:cupin domain-containing protein [Sphingomonas sp. AR_OL41]|uniref:JmjC domain-containing protein n=1 Tax=Sphingomonas sp. AR_OL41 TaxID=3042729 RepID=UPI002480395A|nr:cupin domain-containing protein [Sphingomonas sp. AR_OL41]MDH7972381.1 cupin domain-containing protein [Sphingomonas sp. AR_OL41]
MIADLAGLIAPLSVGAFRQHLARRVPLLLRSEVDVATLLDWDSFFDAALGDDFPARRLRVTKEARQLPTVFYRHRGRVKRDAIAKVLETGGSVIAYDLHRFVPALSRLVASAEAETGEHIVGAAIAGTGEHGALPAHYDDGDLLVIQIAGSKHWVVHADPMIDPVVGAPQVRTHAAPVPLLDTVLAPGDMLLLPAGYRHHCMVAAERSLHIGLFFYPLTAPRTLDLMMRDMIESPVARRPIRGDNEMEPALEAALKHMLRERIERLSLAELRAAHRTVELPEGKV